MTQTTKTLDSCDERQQLLDELNEEYGMNWVEQYTPGSFGCHELLDRTMLVADLVERFVLSHPSCVQNPDWFELAEQAVTALQTLYQQVGAAHMDDNDRKADLNP